MNAEQAEAARERMAGTKTKKWKEIVKVQVPMATNTIPLALVYAKGRRYRHEIEIDDELKKAMNGCFKKFFKARFTENKDEVLCEILLGEEAPWQEW